MKKSKMLTGEKGKIEPVSLFADADDIFQARDRALDIIDSMDSGNKTAALTALFIVWNTLALKYNIEEK